MNLCFLKPKDNTKSKMTGHTVTAAFDYWWAVGECRFSMCKLTLWTIKMPCTQFGECIIFPVLPSHFLFFCCQNSNVEVVSPDLYKQMPLKTRKNSLVFWEMIPNKVWLFNGKSWECFSVARRSVHVTRPPLPFRELALWSGPWDLCIAGELCMPVTEDDSNGRQSVSF